MKWFHKKSFFSQLRASLTFLKCVNGVETDGSGYVVQADEATHHALNRQKIGLLLCSCITCFFK